MRGLNKEENNKNDKWKRKKKYLKKEKAWIEINIYTGKDIGINDERFVSSSSFGGSFFFWFLLKIKKKYKNKNKIKKK